jgi:putative Mg2+ transporter-C (MgtC) family protein
MEPWQFTSWLELDMVIRLLAAALAGGLIGYERQQRDKPAGLRTHILVALGASLFTVLSIYAFGEKTDVARVAAGVVLGVGFLGAGTIIHDGGGRIVGLTTAASIWVVAAIGMAMGVGFYLIGAVSAIMAFAVLRLLARAEIQDRIDSHPPEHRLN